MGLVVAITVIRIAVVANVIVGLYEVTGILIIFPRTSMKKTWQGACQLSAA